MVNVMLVKDVYDYLNTNNINTEKVDIINKDLQPYLEGNKVIFTTPLAIALGSEEFRKMECEVVTVVSEEEITFL